MITAKFTKENAAKLIGTRCAMKSNPRSFLGYKRIIDTEEYAVFEHPVKAASVVAAYGDIVVKRRGNTLFYIPNVRTPFLNYRIELCDRNFPGLIKDSNFMQCLLLPYMRVVKRDAYVKDVRLCVFTDKGQIYHNKPARNKIIRGCQTTAILIHLVQIQIHATTIRMVMAGLKRARKCLLAVKCNCVRVSTDTHRHSSLMPFALLEQEPEMTK